MVICLEQGADLHMAQLMPLPLTVSCSSIIHVGLPFWYWLTWVVLDKGPLNVCSCIRTLRHCLPSRCPHSYAELAVTSFPGRVCVRVCVCDPM